MKTSSIASDRWIRHTYPHTDTLMVEYLRPIILSHGTLNIYDDRIYWVYLKTKKIWCFNVGIESIFDDVGKSNVTDVASMWLDTLTLSVWKVCALAWTWKKYVVKTHSFHRK